MPVVIVELWEGRSVEQKRELVRAITDAMIAHADVRRESLQVILHEISRENWSRGGVLGADREDV
jgi:4-oxalocrotonate tautomerase